MQIHALKFHFECICLHQLTDADSLQARASQGRLVRYKAEPSMEHSAVAGSYHGTKSCEHAVQNFDSVSNIVHKIYAYAAESQDTSS